MTRGSVASVMTAHEALPSGDGGIVIILSGQTIPRSITSTVGEVCQQSADARDCRWLCGGESESGLI
jgi:hypothetical protein